MDRRVARGVILPLVVGYCLVSHRVGELYPFSPLSMFSGTRNAVGRLAVTTPDGRICEVRHFVDWSCGGDVDPSERAHPECAPGHGELDRHAVEWIRSNESHQPGERVTLVRRIYSIPEPGGAVVERRCELAQCEAREIEGSCTWTR